jgi:hypothetical protein
LKRTPDGRRQGVGRARVSQKGRPLKDGPSQNSPKEVEVAKGQKKSNREVRKPKAEKPKPVAAAPSYLTPPSKKK